MKGSILQFHFSYTKINEILLILHNQTFLTTKQFSIFVGKLKQIHEKAISSGYKAQKHIALFKDASVILKKPLDSFSLENYFQIYYWTFWPFCRVLKDKTHVFQSFDVRFLKKDLEGSNAMKHLARTSVDLMHQLFHVFWHQNCFFFSSTI